MLVVMEESAGKSAIDAVCVTASDAGLSTVVFRGEPPMVLLSGVPLREVEDSIAALPGVVRVASSDGSASLVTSNLRIAGIRPLISPAILMEEHPLPAEGAILVQRSRREISRILAGEDDRLLVVVGPCSIHDVDAALDYAGRLVQLARDLADDLLIVLRVYFEKPRTTVGWKGLINDPRGDSSFAVNEGLRIARGLLLDVIELGLPAGCEFLDPVSPQFISDSVTWAAIGARTTESQVHRNLASGLSMPVGFKNGTSGDIQIAVDAISAASYPHHFMSVTEQGHAAIVETRGNRDTHMILRGGRTGPNYDPASVQIALSALQKAGLPQVVMVDASHGNSNKDYREQPKVAAAVAEQVAAGQSGIIGVMLESFLVEGRQDLDWSNGMTYGQSVTDSCMGWDMTLPVLDGLAAAVRRRRATIGS
ncbi:MAG: 3-deoxy-7-phosphoheptulonate synthase [Thermomicrobiales bacterium]